MRLLLLLMTVFSLEAKGQIIFSGAINIPYDDIYPIPPYYSDYSGGGTHAGSISARCFFLTHEAQDASAIDTLFRTSICQDFFLLPGFELGYTPTFKVFHGYHDFLPLDSIYSLPTSRFWRRKKYGQQFCYMDFHARLIIRDLGLQDAHLINRTARRRKDIFVDKQVRVLLVEEILEMTHLPRSSEVKQ